MKFTLIEALIFVFIIAVTGMSIFGAFIDPEAMEEAMGRSRTRCMHGMMFYEEEWGEWNQMIGPNGGGIPCDNY